jgi:aspartate oxidase
MPTDVLVSGAGLARLTRALGVGGPSVIVVNDTNLEADVASAWAPANTLAAAAGMAVASTS